MRTTALVAALLLVSTSSAAQTPSSSSSSSSSSDDRVEVRYRTSSVVEFTPVDIDGEVKGPTGTRIHRRKKVGFRSMITLRSDFRDALSTSTSAL